ncbi:MAG: 23S rRNA (adenine(2503)-C(2))-methyltransferase RlmN [candidate division KSB1 bacterium]|nr:23S rRNA (adenine(2503)-C(2))-methyltransferase RlmN [candidate division KSB1 bacterium]
MAWKHNFRDKPPRKGERKARVPEPRGNAAIPRVTPAPTPGKTLLKGMTLDELRAWVEEQGWERFRADQIFSWMYVKRATSFEQMTDLGKAIRSRLGEIADLGILPVLRTAVSPQTGTMKLLVGLPDGNRVECVYIPEGKRRTVCLSSQVGCPLGCSFCATGQMGFRRNLAAWEILEELLAVERIVGQKLTNVVFMGMGEPLLNYREVMKAADLISDERGISIGHRKIVISTVGMVGSIKRMADEGKLYRLAISLNAADDDTRSQLMPINRRYKIREVLEAARYYYQKTRRRVTFEYVLIRGVNDRKRDAERLRQLLHGFPCKINLIPYNETVAEYQRPSDEEIERFRRWLQPLQAPVIVRWSRGRDIRAACGQLWAMDETETKLSGAGV